MVLLDFRLAVFSLAVLPFFVWMTRRVGRERQRIAGVRQGRLADMSSLVEESLSVSGVLLGKTMGRGDDLARRFSDESRELADLEVRSRMAGRWRMASVQTTFSVMPALVYWFAGLQRQRHDRHRRRLHHPADAAAVPDRLAAERQRRHPDLAVAVPARVRVPRPARRGPRAARARHARRARAARSPSRTSASAMTPTPRRRSTASPSRSRPARRPRWSARPAAARRRSPTSPRASTTPPAGG